VGHAYSPVDDWLGESWYSFGDAAPLYAYEVTVGTGYEKAEGDVWIGTEKTTVDFGNGNTFQLITRWIAHHMNSESGVFELTEIGTIANGTGKLQKATGVFYSPGAFGPGMSGDGKTFLWLAPYQGTICGVDSMIAGTPAAKPQALRPPAPAVRRRR
jgi:hypothetical protein